MSKKPRLFNDWGQEQERTEWTGKRSERQVGGGGALKESAGSRIGLRSCRKEGTINLGEKKESGSSGAESTTTFSEFDYIEGCQRRRRPRMGKYGWRDRALLFWGSLVRSRDGTGARGGRKREGRPNEVAGTISNREKVELKGESLNVTSTLRQEDGQSKKAHYSSFRRGLKLMDREGDSDRDHHA